MMKKMLFVNLALLSLSVLAEPAQLKLVGDFDVEVAYNGKKGIVRIEQPSPFVVANERHAALADYRPNAGGWMRGTKPVGITAQECTTRNALKVETLKVKSSDQADAVVYENGKDYQLTPDWGTVGRLPNGRIQPNQPVYFDYTYVKLRIDAIVLTKDGAFAVRTGVPHQANPSQAELLDGDTRLANIWINGCIPKLTDENLLDLVIVYYMGSTDDATLSIDPGEPRFLDYYYDSPHLWYICRDGLMSTIHGKINFADDLRNGKRLLNRPKDPDWKPPRPAIQFSEKIVAPYRERIEQLGW